jgi:hypothetical protein
MTSISSWANPVKLFSVVMNNISFVQLFFLVIVAFVTSGRLYSDSLVAKPFLF